MRGTDYSALGRGRRRVEEARGVGGRKRDRRKKSPGEFSSPQGMGECDHCWWLGQPASPSPRAVGLQGRPDSLRDLRNHMAMAGLMGRFCNRGRKCISSVGYKTTQCYLCHSYGPESWETSSHTSVIWESCERKWCWKMVFLVLRLRRNMSSLASNFPNHHVLAPSISCKLNRLQGSFQFLWKMLPPSSALTVLTGVSYLGLVHASLHLFLKLLHASFSYVTYVSLPTAPSFPHSLTCPKQPSLLSSNLLIVF